MIGSKIFPCVAEGRRYVSRALHFSDEWTLLLLWATIHAAMLLCKLSETVDSMEESTLALAQSLAKQVLNSNLL